MRLVYLNAPTFLVYILRSIESIVMMMMMMTLYRFSQ